MYLCIQYLFTPEESQEITTESTTTLPLWAAITIGVVGGVLLIVVAIIMIMLCFMLNTTNNTGKEKKS